MIFITKNSVYEVNQLSKQVRLVTTNKQDSNPFDKNHWTNFQACLYIGKGTPVTFIVSGDSDNGYKYVRTTEVVETIGDM